MKRTFAARAVALAAMGMSGLGVAQKPAVTDGPGWTGVTNPKQVIEAREELMVAVERIMEPIDSMEVSRQDPDDVRKAAARISEILLALPHLFPPTTNLYDAAAATPETLALPAIWKSFPTFYELAAAASAAAKKLSETRGSAQQLDEAGDALRGTCDACHALYLRPYVPSKVTAQDRNFDFDSVFENKK